jgi:hypothetical protein
LGHHEVVKVPECTTVSTFAIPMRVLTRTSQRHVDVMFSIIHVKQISQIIAKSSRVIGELSKQTTRKEQIILLDIPGRSNLARVCMPPQPGYCPVKVRASTHTGALYGLRCGPWR